MDIQQLLGQLEVILMESRRVPGTKMRLVDADRCFQLIDQIVLAIPEETQRAQHIAQEYDRLLAQANEEAERILEPAREEASRLTSEEAIVSLARNRAAVIEERTRAEVECLNAESNKYLLETLLRLDGEIGNLKEIVNNGVKKLESAQRDTAVQPVVTPTAAHPDLS
jgi:cell division septum initiation protein DivIVA